MGEVSRRPKIITKAGVRYIFVDYIPIRERLNSRTYETGDFLIGAR